MTALLRTDEVSKAYGGVQALSGASLDVANGSITGLIGPNGSGKTTLFNVITGYSRADSGHVYLDGKAITNPGFAVHGVFMTIVASILISVISTIISRVLRG